MKDSRRGEVPDPGVHRDGVDLPQRRVAGGITVPVGAVAEAAGTEGDGERVAQDRPEPVLGVLTGQVEAPVVGDPEDRERLREEMRERVLGGARRTQIEVFEEQPTPTPEPEPEDTDVTTEPASPQPVVPPEAPQPQGGASSRPRNAGWDT